jgi:molybdopterin molybdotransferase
MLGVSQAQTLVYERCQPLSAVITPLTHACLGMFLAEAVESDLDMPPFTKALMDGYALRATDLPSGQGELEIVEEITAGMVPRKGIGRNQAARIMTGAPLPTGADCVIMVERTKLVSPNRVRIDDQPPAPEKNVLPRGREMRAGETILNPGQELRPQELGLLASVGRTQALLHPRPRVAIVPTGDEIVDIGVRPGPGQIRNSNGAMLAGQAARASAIPDLLGIARDNRDSLGKMIKLGLESDVLLLSGGVSAGKLDLVPEMLTAAGVQAHFHQVAMKPGKPLLFGTCGRTLVFGLPGNPVSSLVCFELFVRPAIRRLMGQSDAQPRTIVARLAQEHRQRGDRQTYHPAVLEFTPEGPLVRAAEWFGSPDLRGLVRADAFAVFPPGDEIFAAGRSVPVLVVER